MEVPASPGGIRTRDLVRAASILLVLSGCRNAPLTDLERLVQARRLAADMLVQFTTATDAGNRAVMAQSDEASAAYVREAEEATSAVEKSGAELAPLLSALNYSAETALLDQFVTRFEQFRTLDRGILGLAVENSNLKAQRLSFGDAQKAADEVRDALAGLPAGPQNAQAWQVQALAATTVAAVREIQVLQAPHIAESDDAAMTRLETRAADAEASARRSLDALGRLVRPPARPRVTAAREALDRFMAVNAQIVVLSRRNSNVRSLALALGEKRTLTATCDESLRALQDALAGRTLGGTR